MWDFIALLLSSNGLINVSSHGHSEFTVVTNRTIIEQGSHNFLYTSFPGLIKVEGQSSDFSGQ